MLMLYMLLALGLNLLLGYAGQFALANAAMFGIGAYGTALLQVKLGWPYWAAAPSGALLAMLIGTALAFPALRLSGIYLALATLAFALVTQWVLMHWETVTFGAGGFAAPVLDLAPLPVDPDVAIYYLSWIVTVGLIALAWSIVRSRLGRAFVAIRDGEIAAQALGIDLLKYKAIAFALSGFYAGTAGALYPPLLGFVAPESFDLFQLVIQKSMVVVGGIGSIMGSIIGATLMVVVLEALREFKAAQEVIFGAVLIAFVIFQPHGVVALFRRLPGWEEPLNSAGSARGGSDDAQALDRPAPGLAADERP
jgi:branched-chain amino acid transport system permease protein